MYCLIVKMDVSGSGETAGLEHSCFSAAGSSCDEDAQKLRDGTPDGFAYPCAV
ncbi:rCG41498, isoform CRA_b [Rattus norvegicus]|uniref:RCG41498, isoform CRA_b n=1 Tax=Rattus norvegicus TaxID=10116 RepID=A6IH60_RAT|nr:rCG41498, isoform CRA_b [Rattus norvegicus]